jgi:hypothetical protein
MYSGTSQRWVPGGLILTCSLLAVSGTTSIVRRLKLRPYCGSCSWARTACAVYPRLPANRHTYTEWVGAWLDTRVQGRWFVAANRVPLCRVTLCCVTWGWGGSSDCVGLPLSLALCTCKSKEDDIGNLQAYASCHSTKECQGSGNAEARARETAAAAVDDPSTHACAKSHSHCQNVRRYKHARCSYELTEPSSRTVQDLCQQHKCRYCTHGSCCPPSCQIDKKGCKSCYR